SLRGCHRFASAIHGKQWSLVLARRPSTEALTDVITWRRKVVSRKSGNRPHLFDSEQGAGGILTAPTQLGEGRHGTAVRSGWRDERADQPEGDGEFGQRPA